MRPEEILPSGLINMSSVETKDHAPYKILKKFAKWLFIWYTKKCKGRPVCLSEKHSLFALLG